jgi:hypothetical protein
MGASPREGVDTSATPFLIPQSVYNVPACPIRSTGAFWYIQDDHRRRIHEATGTQHPRGYAVDHISTSQMIILAVKAMIFISLLGGSRMWSRKRRPVARPIVASPPVPVRRLPVPEVSRSALIAEAVNSATRPERLKELAKDPRLTAAVAANPATPPDVLETVSASWDGEVWRALICNPNAMPDTLFHIAPTYPAEFFANPVVPLLLLEQPNFPLRYDRRILAPLVRHAAAPVGFLSILTHHRDEAIAADARLHVNLVGEAADAGWAREAEGAIWQLRTEDTGRLLVPVLECGSLAPWLVPPLLLHGDKQIRQAVARSPGLPREALRWFRRVGASSDLAGYGAPDPTIAPTLIERLVVGGSWARALAARHPATTPTTLLRLASDPEAQVRAFAARNAALPATALVALAGDSSIRVRQAAACREGTSAAILERLSGDASPIVRTMVARNGKVSAHILLGLTDDPNWRVRRQVARHPGASAETLRRLVADRERLVRYQVVRHPALSPVLRGQMGSDTDPVVRRLSAWVSSRSCPAQPVVEATPVKSSVTTAPTSRQVQEPAGLSESTAEDENRTIQALQALLGTQFLDPVHCAVALAHPALPIVRLSEHVKATDWIERYAVARNPRVPDALLESLAADTNRLVRAAARAARRERAASGGRL